MSQKRASRSQTRVRAQPLIAVRDVRASGRWYRQLLGVENREHWSDHAHLYDRLYCDGALLMQLHAWDEEDHPNLVGADVAPHGHGVLLWFELDDFDAAVERARALQVEIIDEPHVNEAPRHREIWIRDPDGYVVVVASPDGEAAGQMVDATPAKDLADAVARVDAFLHAYTTNPEYFEDAWPVLIVLLVCANDEENGVDISFSCEGPATDKIRWLCERAIAALEHAHPNLGFPFTWELVGG